MEVVENPQKVVVVGAGLGGMAAAIRLAHAGCDVEVWEQNSRAGGKLQEWQQDGFRWDMGPSLLTMPHVLADLFTSVGAKLEEYLTLVRLPSACRYFWSDGTVLDENEAFWKRPDVARFLEYARGIYELSGEVYLNHPPTEFWRAFQPRNLLKLRHLPKVATVQTLAGKVDGFFSDPHLRQLFYRFATYNGSSPYQTPATFNIIPFVEAHFGAWYPRGGMGKIAEAVTRLAEHCGVRFIYGTRAEGYQNGVVQSHNGRTVRADAVVCNGDALQARQTWLASLETKASLRRLLAPELSCSGFVLFLGVKQREARLAHHNIFFSDDYPAEFSDIFQKKQLPRQPTIYVSITARTDPLHSPEGADNYFVLVNSPALASEKESTRENEAYATAVIGRLEAMGLAGLSSAVQVRRIFTMHDFAWRDGTWRGSLYGWASHSIRTSLFRPPLRHARDGRVHFAGGTTHPGGGIPLVLLSGKMVADAILREAR